MQFNFTQNQDGTNLFSFKFTELECNILMHEIVEKEDIAKWIYNGPFKGKINKISKLRLRDIMNNKESLEKLKQVATEEELNMITSDPLRLYKLYKNAG